MSNTGIDVSGFVSSLMNNPEIQGFVGIIVVMILAGLRRWIADKIKVGEENRHKLELMDQANQNSINSFKEQNTQLIAKLDAQSLELSNFKDKMNTSTLEREVKLTALMTQVNSLVEKISSYEKENAKLQGQLLAFESKNKELQSQVESMSSQVSERDKKLSEFQIALEFREQELKSQFSLIDSLSAQVANLSSLKHPKEEITI
jgi:chromosome segregation ATPase